MQPHGIMWSALSQYQTGKIGSRDILYTMRERANKLKKFCQHSGLADAWTSSFNSRCTDIYSHVFVKVNGNWIWLIFATQFSLWTSLKLHTCHTKPDMHIHKWFTYSLNHSYTHTDTQTHTQKLTANPH